MDALINQAFERAQSATEKEWDRLFGWLHRHGADEDLLEAVRAAQRDDLPFPVDAARAHVLLSRYVTGGERGPMPKDAGTRIGVIRAPGTPLETEGPKIEP